ncbi:hypothetical protein K6119_05815 [Paracrocinitomix mangrovi]|uniref:hypothetical protein n=1 Tax=Paracrocinitomix mangrovi TaxID=2862509 RepID=UPI001C8E5059|nr:hypothetical protein [Paracrocinitomix mangrovi]UKN03031.1 hypothetical protein K6119_05815 [Paracrocinitomix mangrovi]
MKKALLVSVLGVFALGMFSCGHSSCDAYRTTDYTKYKKEQNQKIQLLEDLTKTRKK